VAEVCTRVLVSVCECVCVSVCTLVCVFVSVSILMWVGRGVLQLRITNSCLSCLGSACYILCLTRVVREYTFVFACNLGCVMFKTASSCVKVCLKGEVVIKGRPVLQKAMRS